MADGAAGDSQPRERRESGHHPVSTQPKKDKKKPSEHSTKDTSRHKGRRSRQTSQCDTNAPDHADATKSAGNKRDGHLPKSQVAPSTSPAKVATSTAKVATSTAKVATSTAKVATSTAKVATSTAKVATSAVSATKTKVTDVKVAGHSQESSSESTQPASG